MMKVTNTLLIAINEYDIIVITVDLNIDASKNEKDTNHCLCDLIDTFSLSTLVTCYKSMEPCTLYS